LEINKNTKPENNGMIPYPVIKLEINDDDIWFETTC